MEKTNVADTIYDTYEDKKTYTSINTDKDDEERINSGYLLSSLNLTAPETATYTLSSYRASNLSTLYFSKHDIYLVFNFGVPKGCDIIPEFSVISVNRENLTINAESKQLSGAIPNRYCLYDSGEYLIVISFEKNIMLHTLTKDMQEVLMIQNIAPVLQVKSCYFSGNFCYIESENSATKIDVSNPISPLIVGESQLERAGEFLMPFGSDNMLGVSLVGGNMTVNYYEVTGDEFYNINSISVNNVNFSALVYRNIPTIPEHNIATVCGVQFAYVFDMDDYGYLEQKKVLMLAPATDLPSDAAKDLYHINRIVYIDEYLYAISNGNVASYSATTLEKVSGISTVL